MIFMSDGEDGSKQDSVALMGMIKNQFECNHKFICHTVGFGNGITKGSPPAELLKKIAAAGGGKAYSALNGIELKNAFEEVAINSSTSNILIEHFSDVLAHEISDKILVDYL
jgi:hypothetical protein